MQSFSEIIRNRHGERLDYAFHPTQGEARGLVILGHGVTGNKDRPLLIALAEALEASGFPSCAFPFQVMDCRRGTLWIPASPRKSRILEAFWMCWEGSR